MDKFILREFFDLRDGNVHNYLVELLDKQARSLCTVKDEVTFRQIQGKSQMLLELIELIEKSDDLIKQLDAAKTNKSHMF